jgi:hypothetical protein
MAWGVLPEFNEMAGTRIDRPQPGDVVGGEHHEV